MTKRVIIIGGGITGLTAAYHLQKQPNLQVMLLEKSDRLGGKIGTHRVGEYLVEQGPDSIVKKPELKALITELGLEDEVIQPKRSRFFIYTKGKLEPVPAGLSSMVPQDMPGFLSTRLLSWKGKIRLGLEALVPARKELGDESFASFIRRRFGNEMLDQLAGPLFAGIHAGEADQMSLEATFPQYKMMEQQYGSITKAVLQRRKQIKGPPPSVFSGFREGIGTLPQRLEERLDRVEVRCNTKVTKLHYFQDRYQVMTETQKLEADYVVLAVPAPIAAPLLKENNAQVAKLLQTIEFSSSTIATFAVSREQAGMQPEATGFLIPQAEQRVISACTWSSEKWEHRAPNDKLLIRCFITKQWQEIDDETILQKAWEEISHITKLRGEPELRLLQRWPIGQAKYKVGHLELMGEIDMHMKKLPGIFLAGTSYRGSGIADCVRQGKEVAEKIIQQLS